MNPDHLRPPPEWPTQAPHTSHGHLRGPVIPSPRRPVETVPVEVLRNVLAGLRRLEVTP
ncbi:hypothetical protein [Nocardiopsis sp. NPDC006938]|uniref:hypothetical protein n=1 Tax=Nocardiopsis sp. NPDC006938 TaxID=3364337 RepID=UPI0036C9A085